MGNAIELCAYVLANVGFVAISGTLAGLSLHALRRHPDQRSYTIAAAGFGCIMLGGLVESVYSLWYNPTYLLSGAEFLTLQAVEDVVIAIGLGLLFLAITTHEPGTHRADEAAEPFDEARLWRAGTPHDD